MKFGTSNVCGICVESDSETNEEHYKDYDEKWFQLVMGKLDRWLEDRVRIGFGVM